MSDRAEVAQNLALAAAAGFVALVQRSVNQPANTAGTGEARLARRLKLTLQRPRTLPRRFQCVTHLI
jgi:hypothetical protein